MRASSSSRPGGAAVARIPALFFALEAVGSLLSPGVRVRGA